MESDAFQVLERQQKAVGSLYIDSNCRVIKQEEEAQGIEENVLEAFESCEHRETPQERNEFLESTAAVLKQYRAESFLCDMIILVDDGELPAHSAILCASSPVVKSSMGLLTDLTVPYRLQFHNVKKAVMELVLDAVYTGRLDLEVVNQLNVRQLLDTLNVDVKKMVKYGTPSNGKADTHELSSSGISFDRPMQTCESPDNSALNYDSIDDLENIGSSSFQADEPKQPELTNTEHSSATTTPRTEYTNSTTSTNILQSASSDTNTVMSTGDAHADKIAAILNETCKKFWSTGRCPCRNCQAKTSDAAPFRMLPEVFHCDYCLFRTREITNLYEHIRRRCKFIDIDEYGYMKPSPAPNSEFRAREPQWDGTYPCDLCSEVFDDQSAILDHVLLVHRGQKEFKCDICNKVFQRESYKQHRRFHAGVHTSETPELCHLCGQQFPGRLPLGKHLTTAHGFAEYNSSSSTLKCPRCVMTFTKPASVASHMERDHGIAYSGFDLGVTAVKLQFVCEKCGASFGSGGMFVKHQRGCKF